MTETTPPADRAAILNEAADVLAALREKTDVNVAEYARYDFRQRIALSDGISRLRRMAGEAQQPTGCDHDSQVIDHEGHQYWACLKCGQNLGKVAVEAQQPETQAAVCMCGHPMHQHHEDVCLIECGCNDGRELDNATDLPDRLAAALTARFTELGNPFAAMRHHEQAADGWPSSHPVGPNKVADVLRELLAHDEPAAVSQPGKEA
jgi:hypothetical protein